MNVEELDFLEGYCDRCEADNKAGVRSVELVDDCAAIDVSILRKLLNIAEEARVRGTDLEEPERGERVLVWDRRQNHGKGDWVIYVGNMVVELPELYPHWKPLPSRPE